MLKPDDVIAAYRLLLGREPESEQMIQNFVNHSDFDRMRSTLLGSDEFAVRLARDPNILPLSALSLMMSPEMKRYARALESLISLSLPLWDNSVLILGDDASALAPFFLDRMCRVTISASPEKIALARNALSGDAAASANATFIDGDFAGVLDREPGERYDLVYGDLPEADSDGMRIWFDNVAEACSETLVVGCALAPGRSEDVFVTYGRNPNSFKAVPTYQWVVSRLRERFDHVCVPDAVAEIPSRPTPAAASILAERRATFVASRREIDRPHLKQVVAERSKPRLSGVA